MFRSRTRCWLKETATLVAVLGLTVQSLAAAAQGQRNPNPEIVPNSAKYRTLSAEWWQWAISAPTPVNPLVDPTGANCGQGQGEFSADNVWFLAGTSGGSVTRTCLIPPGKSLFFPVLNTFFACDPP